MYQLKTKVTPQAVADLLDAITDESLRNDCYTIAGMMEQATGQPATMWGSAIVGFDSYHYKYASGHEGDMCLVGFSPRKNNISLYLMLGDGDNSLLLQKLGKHKISKACLYIKKIADVDATVLQDIINQSAVLLRAKYPL